MNNVSKNVEFVWSPRDLTAPDFFLWSYLKKRIYVNTLRTTQELKKNIRVETQRLGPEILRTVI